MTFTTQHLTNEAYGYPRGAERRYTPTHLICIHITANPSTPPASAQQERNYADRAGSNGPSAHDYIDRDGDGIHAIDPAKYAAWSNGALRSPKTSVPGVQAVVDAKAAGTNPNECYYREVECCGRDPEYPLNDAQTDTIARLIADDSLVTGIPISRASVHLHSDLDSVNRANDPVPAPKASAFVSTVIEKAIAYRNMSELDDAKAVIAAQEKEIAALEDQISMMSAEIDDLTDRLETTEAKIASASLILEQGAEMRAHTALKGQPA